MATKIPDNELSIVGEICVKQDGYEVHTGTKSVLNLDVVKDIFSENNKGFNNVNDFMQNIFEEQLNPVIEQFTIEGAYIKVYGEIKD